jgi:hypothetical protein
MTALRVVRKTADLAALVKLRPNQLKKLYREMFGQDVSAANSELARRRIAWRIQANAEGGGLPESAREYALAIAQAYKRCGPVSGSAMDLPHSSVSRLVPGQDSRTPPPGSVLIKEFRGQQLTVRVLHSGFEYDNRKFKSLSAIANEVTGTKWNGFLFFGLTRAHGR